MTQELDDRSSRDAAMAQFMQRALEATRTTYPHPNPRVGAVLTAPDGTQLATGAHDRAGGAHAESIVLEAAEFTQGTTLYVTLEPCNHHGRTPPCTDAIIRAGVERVVVGAVDPDERVRGSGIKQLEAAGIAVQTGVLVDDVIANDRAYFHHRVSGRPFVTLKVAATLDGQVAAADGSSRWISSPESRLDAHHLRAEQDAIIVGAGTVISDDPALTVRIDGYTGRQPLPVVMAGDRVLPPASRILTREHALYEGTPDPRAVIDDLSDRGMIAVMIEGGPTIASSFLEAGVVDEIVWYAAGKLARGTGIPALSGVFETIGDLIDLTVLNVVRVGTDLRITAKLQ